MRLYHFTRKEHALENIEKQRLKVATIDGLNDPFEFYINFSKSGVLLDEEKIEEIKSNYTYKMGILCFSTKKNDPVQWAHYTDNHKGICMEFEIPREMLVKVEYLKEPVSVDVDQFNWPEKFVDATKSKYQHWSYEREYRIVVDLRSEGVKEENGLYFADFSEYLRLKKVYSGLRCELSKEEREVLNNAGIQLGATRKDRNSYSILTD